MNDSVKVDSMLAAIKFGVWRFVLTAGNSGILPGYKGSTLRGAFGMALRRMSCGTRMDTDCKQCRVSSNCIYAQTFESVNEPETAGDKFLGCYGHIPHPFAFSDRSGGVRQYCSGDVLTFELLLIGPYIGMLPHYTAAIKEAALIGLGNQKKVRFVITSVTDNNGNEIYDPSTCRLDEGFVNSAVSVKNVINGIDADEVKLEFITPLRLVHDGKMVKNLDFVTLASSLLRRFSALAAYHMRADAGIDAAGYLKEAEKVSVTEDSLRWVDWERDSNRQKRKVQMGGLTGAITFKGEELNKYMPLLQLGEKLRTGKGTVMGMGEYKLEQGGMA
jgi:hypothetical protein